MSASPLAARPARPRAPHTDKVRRATAKTPPADLAGLAARETAVALIAAVLLDGRTLEAALGDTAAKSPIEPRDRAFAREIAATVLRRRGSLERVVAAHLAKPLPERQGIVRCILLAGAAQLLVLGTPPHAAINLAVEQCRCRPSTTRFDKLVNAVLRRVNEAGPALLATLKSDDCDIPAWMMARWRAAYGADIAARIAEASLTPAPLDLSVKSDPDVWADKLGGFVLPGGTVRLAAGGRVDHLAGYAEGAWWVQDAAAALPVRLFGDVRGLRVADLCAAPGGKTAALIVAGAEVTAIDRPGPRLDRLAANLQRLHLAATVVAADAAAWISEAPFAGVLLDAPCTATGTIRRHPDILSLKRPADVAQLAETQKALLENAARLVAPGGCLVYCTCSLEPEEGAVQLDGFLGAHPEFRREPIVAHEIDGAAEWITSDGDLRTLPHHLPHDRPELSGMDGFYAARLRKRVSW